MGRHYTLGEYLEHVGALRAAVPARQRHDRRDRRLPDRGPRARSSARSTRSTPPGSPACTRSPYSPRPGHGRRAARRPRRAGGEEAPLAGAARALGGALAPPPHRQARRAPSGCWSTRSPTPSARATRPTTRAATCPPAPRARGEMVDVACEELHADGIALPGSAGRRGTILKVVSVTEQVRADMTSAMKAGEQRARRRAAAGAVRAAEGRQGRRRRRAGGAAPRAQAPARGGRAVPRRRPARARRQGGVRGAS